MHYSICSAVGSILLLSCNGLASHLHETSLYQWKFAEQASDGAGMHALRPGTYSCRC